MTFQRNEPRRRVVQVTLNVESYREQGNHEILLISPDIAEELCIAGATADAYHQPDDSQQTTTHFLSARSVIGHLPSFGWTIFRARVDASLPMSSCKIQTSNLALYGSHYVELTTVSPPTLKTVVISCPKAIYDANKADPETKNRFIQALYSNGQLVRRGDFYNDISCRVKLCEPVDQGLLDIEATNISLAVDTLNEPDTKDIVLLNDLDLEISEYLRLDTKLDAASSTNYVQAVVTSLHKPINPQCLTPVPQFKVDMESCVFAKIELLAKIGCFSGDFISIEPLSPASNNSDEGDDDNCATTGSKARHVRIFSFPEPNPLPANEIKASPFLVYNLGLPTTANTVIIKKVVEADSIPTCTEVTISRVSAPLTTERVYQTSFLSGLRKYFESANRIVRLNDIIAIPIDTLLAETLQNLDTKDLPAILPQGQPNNAALFQISSISQYNDGRKLSGSCFIDSKQTKLIQSGLMTVPCIPTRYSWREYLGLPAIFSFQGSSETDFSYAKKLEKFLDTSTRPTGRYLCSSVLLKSSKRGAGKSTLVQSICAKLGIHFFEIDCYQIVGEGDNKTIGFLKARLERASSINPCVVILKHLEAVSGKSDEDGSDSGLVSNVAEVLQDCIDNESFILAATVNDIEKVSESIRGKFKLEIEVGVPTESERLAIFRFFQRLQPLTGRDLLQQIDNKAGILSGYKFKENVQLSKLALQSAGLILPDLISIIKNAKRKAELRYRSLADTKNAQLDLIIASEGLISISPDDFDDAIQEARSKYSDSIGAPKIPNVKWSDVGGLEGVKQDILDTIEMPLKYPHLFSSGVKKRSGILFYGPPGTGKTLLAKAIATNFSLNFFSVKGPELLNMYIGESEANVRKVFQKARDAKPCVVFFDELDSVAPKRGNQGDSGGVMDRIVSQLLAELDGMSGSDGEGVFVVGATNRPDLLDEALLRPGRFDRMLYLGISDTHDKQQNILKALTRKFTLNEDADLQKIAEQCSFNYTGADFYALCSDAYLNAIMRTAAVVDEKIKAYNRSLLEDGKQDVSTRWWFQNLAQPEDTNVTVKQEDFVKALKNLIPSVSVEELNHYLAIKEGFEGVAKGDKQEQSAKSNGPGTLKLRPEEPISMPKEQPKDKPTADYKGKGKQKIK